MHIGTVVRVSAPNKEEAIKLVKALVANNYEELPSPFDWYDEEAIQISEEIKTEDDFKKLREAEIREYKITLEKALAMPDTDTMKGYYLRKAGESLEAELFWSTERMAYNYDEDYGYVADPKVKMKVFYIDTDRHCQLIDWLRLSLSIAINNQLGITESILTMLGVSINEMKSKLVMVEFINDNNCWTWYGVYKNITPQEAIKEYCYLNGLKSGRIKWDTDAFYCNEDVRAYEIELSKLYKKGGKTK